MLVQQRGSPDRTQVLSRHLEDELYSVQASHRLRNDQGEQPLSSSRPTLPGCRAGGSRLLCRFQAGS